MKPALIIAVALTISTGLLSGQSFADKIGPKLGSKVPKFEAKDQEGKSRNLDSLAGGKGTILVFIRSADW